MYKTKEDHVMRQAFNVMQLLPTNPVEAQEVLYLVRQMIEHINAPYFAPPSVH